MSFAAFEPAATNYKGFRLVIQREQGRSQVIVFNKMKSPIFCTWTYENGAEALDEARRTIDGFSSGRF
jgi:hypothetical protein